MAHGFSLYVYNNKSSAVPGKLHTVLYKIYEYARILKLAAGINSGFVTVYGWSIAVFTFAWY